MFTTTLRKVGNSAALYVPREELERIGLKEGDTVSVEVRPVRVVIEPVLAEDLRPAFEEMIGRSQKALKLLAES